MHESFLRVERENDIAIVVLDLRDSKVNTLSTSMLDAIDETMTELFNDSGTRGIVVISGKDSGFIAGADVRELRDLRSPLDAEAISRRGHAMMQRVRSQSKPVVAAIHGAALGGGLEFALACDYRIASHDAKLGLPEVKLGLLPGGGGTQLLPRLVGLQEALGMMLTGKNIYARKARRMGLVDATVHRPGLRQAAIDTARSIAIEGLPVKPSRGTSFPMSLLEKTALTRKVVYKKAQEQVTRTTRGNYPAPYHILTAVRTGIEDGMEAGLDMEARLFGELVFSDVSRELVFLFFAQQEATRNPFPDGQKAHAIGVLGGGLMGGGIAALSAKNGVSSRVKDLNLELAASARRVARDYATGLMKKGAMSRFERDRLVERVVPVESYQALAGVDAVIEAVPESLEIKHDVLRETEAVIGEDAIFATNTSSIPITRIAEASSRPEQVLGMHYFSPVPQVPLLEIIRTKKTSPDAVARAFDIGLQQGKTVIVVNDGPGFYTTRILAIYMNEALLLLEEGGDVKEIDNAMRDFGFPMGPFALFDLVGIDVAAKIADVLDPFFAERGMKSSTLSRRLLEAGLKGHKTNLGFYEYDERSSGPPKRKSVNSNVYAFAGGSERKSMEADDVQKRLSLIMINEAVRCLDEGILERPQDGDVGAVFGLGFPPFLGGPFRYADRLGARAMLRRLSDHEAAHGIRFDPAPGIIERARSDGRFYD
jgi:3-hydroxyacyl-CoA dehydrogenase / enoyl-CoA hydratase / 3-hydroxybutyryl-CoA epimerase